jgi:uncharacterized protein (DUF1697 family)
MALVVFLRGVNVGGYRTFRPRVLAAELKDYGVVNVGATGTFIVRKSVSQSQLRAELLRRLPFEARAMICKGHELVSFASSDPFAGVHSRPDVIRFVSVLERRPRTLPSIPLSLPAGGKWVLKVLGTRNRFLFGLYRRQMSAIGYLGSIDKVFGVCATTRNWNTISTIVDKLKTGEFRNE